VKRRGCPPSGREALRPGDRGASAEGGARVAGQATVETVALIPAMLAVGLGLMQLLAVGYASVLAGSAAEAGALALAAGADARAGVKESLPGWADTRARISVEGGRIEVRLRPPSPMRVLAEGLEVTAEAAVEAP
jgi:hypothetical protein